MSRTPISVFVAVVLTVALGAGCAIRADSAPNDIPAERNDVFGEPARGDEAAGTNRIFLLAPADPDASQNLRSALRDVAASPSAILGSLFAGPNVTERENQIDTAIPADAELLSPPRTVGSTLTINVNDVFGDLNADGLILAVAQIVATASELEGIETVQLRVDGDARVWPLGNGELTDRALTIYDYPGIVESSQPPFPAIPTADG